MNTTSRLHVAAMLRKAAATLSAPAMSLLDKLFLAALLNKETVMLVAEEARHLAVKSKGAADAAIIRKQLATDKSLLDVLTHNATAAAPTLHKVLDKYLERFDHRGYNLAIGDGGAVFIEVENTALAIRFEAVSAERVWDDPGINGEPLGDDDFTIVDNMGADVSDFLSKVLKPTQAYVSPEVYSEDGNDFFAYGVGLTHSLPKDFVEQVLRGLEQRFPTEFAKAINDGIADAAE